MFTKLTFINFCCFNYFSVRKEVDHDWQENWETIDQIEGWRKYVSFESWLSSYNGEMKV